MLNLLLQHSLKQLILNVVILSLSSIFLAAPAYAGDDDMPEKAHPPLKDRMPSAATCGGCHPKHYKEWAGSQHAYAQLSPVFNTMQAAVLQLTNGTNGDFCIRCHTAAGMDEGEPLFMDNTERNVISRQGVTCITCHRMKERLGKVNGRLPIEQGKVSEAVYGPSGDKNLKKALKTPGTKFVTRTGAKIHEEVNEFNFITESGFCATCHDVTLVNGFRLEEAFSEYKSSPAAKRGETCQDCHMGKIPGIASGYEHGPAAVIKVNGEKHAMPARKLTDHRFIGPDYPVIHPGIFPHNIEAEELLDEIMDEPNIAAWTKFDIDAGWGTDEFEDKVSDSKEFPEPWEEADDRIAAREIIEKQLEHREEMSAARKALLQRAYLLEDTEVQQATSKGLKFRVKVKNGTDGHNAPTGFTGERLVWLSVNVKDSTGKSVFKSGDLDPNGDVRDSHSAYVHNGEIKLDKQLFSLQSKFLTRLLRGGEREQILPVNFSTDPLPFLRPDSRPSILTGRTTGARIHKQGIEPNGHRWAEYVVDQSNLSGHPPYTAEIQLKAAMIPVNLINRISFAGFDYGLSPRDIADDVVAGHQVLAEKTVSLGGQK